MKKLSTLSSDKQATVAFHTGKEVMPLTVEPQTKKPRKEVMLRKLGLARAPALPQFTGVLRLLPGSYSQWRGGYFSGRQSLPAREKYLTIDNYIE